MGTRFTTLSPLFAVAALALPAPAGAQQDAAPLPSLPRPQTPPPQSDPARQGPELDVFRDVPGTAPAPAAPPSITTTVPPPIVAPTPALASERQAPQTQRQPRERSPARAMPAAAPATTATPPGPAPVETPQPSSRPVAAPQVDNAPENAAEEARSAPPVLATPDAAVDGALPWGWIGAALAVLLAAGVALVLRRRPRSERKTDDNEDTGLAAVVSEPTPTPVTPTKRPAPASVAERAWIDIDLTIDSARYSLVGVSIGYRLTLRNRGKSVASDLLVHALIGNADANQNELLRAFFAGTKGMPVHSVVSIAPGETQILTNELRLEPDAIEPLELDGRLLLVPLIGFDVHYRWETGGTPGGGRSGSAFIVGQERVPPTQKLVPFRFDQGPRDYRDVGNRRTALSLAS